MLVVKAEDKLIRPAKVESKWGGAPSYKVINIHTFNITKVVVV